MQDKESMIKFWEKIKDVRVCMLTTFDCGIIRARPMTIIQREFDGSIWLMADETSATVSEIKKEGIVNLSFVDKENDLYASISGHAKINAQPEKIEEFENFMTKAWFSNSQTGDPLLIEVVVEFGEFWESNKSTIGKIIELGLASVSDHRPDLGENKKVASH